MKFTHLDLFSGLGAFSIGFERRGFKTLAQVEIDKNCRKLLLAKWPTAAKHDDVQTFDPDSIECPGVVTFGSPCQDLSIAGKRAGMAGERSGLFYHATRIIQRLVGRGLEFALWENVEGAFSSNERRDFAGVLARLGECGAMDIGWRVLDCQYFGLAQRRRRVFLVADFRGRRADKILSFAEGLQGHPAPSREVGQTIAPTIRAGAPNGGKGHGARSGDSKDELIIPVTANRIGCHHRRDDLDHDTYIPDRARRLRARSQSSHREDSETFIPCVARSLTAENGQRNNGTEQNFIVIAHSLKAEGADASEDGTGRGTPLIAAICFEPRYYMRDNKTGGKPSEIAGPVNASDAKRGDAQRVCAGNFGVRRLTPRECERLMGLPDDWTAGFSDSVRYRMLGNSVAVPVVEWLANNIKAALAS